ncbi:MAG: PGF-pre-PGF domain-containing protein [Nanoarchaeota archaeon]|nr:PGF-pre-PGF domain-containing protein [Nanoarchaeota archaeon]
MKVKRNLFIIMLLLLTILFMSFSSAANCDSDTSCNCGDTLIGSRVLNITDSLSNCTVATALTINSNVDLDCNWYNITGNGSVITGIEFAASTNVSIQKCIVSNITTTGIRVGSNSAVLNNNITNLKTGSVGLKIISENNVTVLNNSFERIIGSPTGFSITSGTNLVFINNVFSSAFGNVIAMDGTFNNVSFVNNIYSGLSSIGFYLFGLGASSRNITIRNQNVSGTVDPYKLDYIDNSGIVRFINTSITNQSNQEVRFLSTNTSFTYSDNSSSGKYLTTRVNNSAFDLLRDIVVWNALNISVQDIFTKPDLINYSVFTDLTYGGVRMYVGNVLNNTFLLNGSGFGETSLTVVNNYYYNLTFTFDIDGPNVTVNSPAAALGAGTASTVLNITTNENATCRYNSTNQLFGNMYELTNTNNLTHNYTLRSLADSSSYTYYVKCVDIFGTQFNTTVNFTTGTPAATTSSSSGGGGGGSAAVSNRLRLLIDSASMDNPINFSVSNDDIPLNYIYIKVNKELANLRFTIESWLDKPTDLDELDLEIYKYLTFTLTGFTNDDIDNAEVSFFVPASWVVENDVDLDLVTLFRYSDGWEELDTSYLGRQGDNYLFLTEMDGFSDYVIAVKESSTEELLVEDVEIVEEGQEVITEGDILFEEMNESKGYNNFLVGLIIIIILGMVYFFFKKGHKLHKRRKHKKEL